jgi:hypothetical protein
MNVLLSNLLVLIEVQQDETCCVLSNLLVLIEVQQDERVVKNIFLAKLNIIS